jgi:YfiH family protein
MSAAGFAADWPAPPGVRTWQTTREGGVSADAFATMNLALHVDDDAAAVVENRARLRSTLNLPGEPVWLDQVHGCRILDLDRGESGSADGAVTTNAGQVLAVMTADCLPVLLASKDGCRIGAAHAGWRGLANGVLDAAVGAFSRPAGELCAWLGPAIGRGAFEVGDDVRAAFIATDSDAASAFDRNARGRWQADLHALGQRALLRLGVNDIYGAARCTFADSRQFYSHRREAPCGRMASLIWRTG